MDAKGEVRMVDVSDKAETHRIAIAEGTILMHPETQAMVLQDRAKKGDVLACARVAGIMAIKRTSDIIPMCHPIALTGVDLSFTLDREQSTIEIFATTRCTGETGVEMEAMTAASVAALTIYDMCKAAQRDIVIESVRLLEKSGGKSGHYQRKE